VRSQLKIFARLGEITCDAEQENEDERGLG
jgi:hypothetical protein